MVLTRKEGHMKIKELAEKLNNASAECYEDLKNGNFISFKEKESPKKVAFQAKLKAFREGK